MTIKTKIIKKAYKFRCYPNDELKIFLAKHFGCNRFIFNFLLNHSEENFKTKYIIQEKLNPQTKEIEKVKVENPSYKNFTANDRIKYIKTLKNEDEFKWLKEVSSVSLQQSVMHLNTAYERFFAGKSSKPTFKKKLNKNSFTITGKDTLKACFSSDFVKTKKFYLPKTKESLNIQFSQNFNHLAVSSFTMSVNPSGKYFISFLVEKELTIKEVKTEQGINNYINNTFLNKKKPIKNSKINNYLTKEKDTNINNTLEKTIELLNQKHDKMVDLNNENNDKNTIDVDLKTELKTISFDLGLKTNIKTFNGKEFNDYNLPILLKSIDKKLKKAQKELSRKKAKSSNRNKQRIKVAKLHEKRNNIVENFYQQLSSKIINENQVIICEDLNVAGMKRNKKLANAIHQVAWGRFLKMLEYKALWHDRVIIKANRFYASSKLCSNCKTKNHSLKLSDRVWKCSNESCLTIHDRDENACLNLYQYDDDEFKKEQKSYKAKEVKEQKVKPNTTGTVEIDCDKTQLNACGDNVRLRPIQNNHSDKSKLLSVKQESL
jgi:IS605 OrfB family transposase